MSKRSIRQEDSLEMLLDTMCNAFGGLILIAILIAILARTSDVEPGLEDQVEYLRALGENRKLKREAEVLKGQFTNINDRVEAINPGITNIMEELTSLIAEATRKGELVKDVEKTAGKTDDIVTDATDLREKNDTLAEEIRKADREKNRLEMELEKAKDLRAVEVRAPNAQVVRLQSVNVVIKDGKFWAIHNFDRPRTKNFNSRVCDIQRDGRGGVQKLKPKPGVGVAIPDNLDQLKASQIGSYFKIFPKEKYLCKMFIHKSSFKEGHLIINMLVKSGIKYNWIPDPRNEIEFVVGLTGPERSQ